MRFNSFVRLSFVLLLGFGIGCATSGKGPYTETTAIPAGKGRLTLVLGGIEQINFSIYDKATSRKVTDLFGLQTYLDPGTYKLVVQTDLDQSVVIDNVKVTADQETPVQVQVGRFMVQIVEEQQQQQQQQATQSMSRKLQLPFVIYDYNLKKVLGKGTTSYQVKHYIAPVGVYRLRIQPSISSQGQVTKTEIVVPLSVEFGKIAIPRRDSDPPWGISLQ